MQKNILAILSFMLLVGSTNVSLAKDDAWTPLKKVCIIAGVTSIATMGKYTSDMNKEYSKTNKKADLKMRTAKVIGAASLLLGTDLLTGDTSNTYKNLAKITAFGIASVAVTDTVANIVREIPGVGGLLTDPVDENGKEVKDLGAAARVLLLYVPVAALAVSAVSSSS